MKDRIRRASKNAPTGKGGGKEFLAAKISKKFKPKAPYVAPYERMYVSKADAQLLMGLVNTPFKPNEATLEARRMNAAIPRISR